MTGIIPIGVAERGSLKKYVEAVHILQRLCIESYSESTVHMQNQLKAGSFIGTKAELSHDVQFFSYAHSMK